MSVPRDRSRETEDERAPVAPDGSRVICSIIRQISTVCSVGSGMTCSPFEWFVPDHRHHLQGPFVPERLGRPACRMQASC